MLLTTPTYKQIKILMTHEKVSTNNKLMMMYSVHSSLLAGVQTGVAILIYDDKKDKIKVLFFLSSSLNQVMIVSSLHIAIFIINHYKMNIL